MSDAAASGAVRRGWPADLADSLAVLLSPGTAYRRLAERRPLLVPWLLVALPTMVLNGFMISIAQRASVHLLDRVEDPELVAAVAGQLEGMKVVAVLAAPFALLLRWGILAVLLWAAGTFLLPASPLRTMMCVVACAGLPEVLGRAVDLWVTWTVGPELGPDLVPHLTTATSVAALFPRVGGTWLGALLDRLTPFALWSAALWTIGVRETAGVGTRRALAVTLPVWSLVVAAGTATEVLRGSLTGLVGPGAGG
jgi:hypothetical protein